jgi:hypothetical protein
LKPAAAQTVALLLKFRYISGNELARRGSQSLPAGQAAGMPD